MKTLHLINNKYVARCGIRNFGHGVKDKYSFVYSLTPFALCRECLQHALQHRMQRTARIYAEKLLSENWRGLPAVVSSATRRN